jgi:transposase InsO family protein
MHVAGQQAEGRRTKVKSVNAKPTVMAKNISKKRSAKANEHIGVLGRVAPMAVAAGIEGWSPEYIAQQQAQDGDIAPVFEWIANGRPDWSAVKSSSPALRALFQQFESIIVRDGCLYRIFHNSDGSTDHLQLILPHSMKIPFLELIHASAAGHLKTDKCIYHVMRRAWWYNFKRDVKVYCACCQVCNAYHRGNPPKQAHLRPIVLGGVCERWSIDLCGPFVSSEGKTYICTCIDPFSKYCVNVAIRNKEASTVARVIFEHLITTWGLCEEVLSDQGPEFCNGLANELYKLLGIHKIRTSAYTPKSNGCCEKAHQVLNKLLAKVVSESQRDWARWLPYATFCYNATPNASTGFAPHFIMTGQEPRWDIDFLIHSFEPRQQTVSQYAAETLDRLHKVHALVRENLQQAAISASRWYNKKTVLRNFSVNSRVRVYNPRRYKGRTPKWQSFYKDVGVVKLKLNDASYVISCPSWKADKIVHVDKLKLVTEFH